MKTISLDVKSISGGWECTPIYSIRFGNQYPFPEGYEHRRLATKLLCDGYPELPEIGELYKWKITRRGNTVEFDGWLVDVTPTSRGVCIEIIQPSKPKREWVKGRDVAGG